MFDYYLTQPVGASYAKHLLTDRPLRMAGNTYAVKHHVARPLRVLALHERVLAEIPADDYTVIHANTYSDAAASTYRQVNLFVFAFSPGYYAAPLMVLVWAGGDSFPEEEAVQAVFGTGQYRGLVSKNPADVGYDMDEDDNREQWENGTGPEGLGYADPGLYYDSNLTFCQEWT